MEDLSKSANLLKLEAMGLFVRVKSQLNGTRWKFFTQSREDSYPLNILQTISPYRASLHFSYVFQAQPINPKTGIKGEIMTITSEVYLEREAGIGALGENHWVLSFTGLEGKVKSLLLADQLSPLAAKGYYIPNGNENLERQMNFSLGLYGTCMMHVDVHFPIDKEPYACFLEVFDHLEFISSQYPLDHKNILLQSQADLNDDDETEDGLVIMGDWQTWK